MKAMSPSATASATTAPHRRAAHLRRYRTLAAAAIAALLWLSLLLFECVAPYPLRDVLRSPVLRCSMGFAAAICGAVAFLVAMGSVAAAYLVRRSLPNPAAAARRTGLEMTIAALASALVLLLRVPLQAWAANTVLAPETVLALLVGLAVSLAAATMALVSRAVRPRWRGHLWLGSASLALLVWYEVVGHHLALDLADVRWWILVVVTLPLGGLLLRQANGGVRVTSALRLVLLGIAAAVPVVSVAGWAWSDFGEPDNAPRLGAGRAPNVVILLIDTWRADHTTPGGYDRDTTPNLAALQAAGATYFSQAEAAGTSTVPSVKALFTGLPPSAWGVANVNQPPPSGAWTMAEAFQRSGYATGAFSANALIDAPGFRRGFQRFWTADGNAAYRKSFLRYALLSGGSDWDAFTRMKRLGLHKVDGDTIRAVAAQWTRQVAPGPFFLYLHIVEPHWPRRDQSADALEPYVSDAPDSYSYLGLLQLDMGSAANAARRSGPAYREMIERYDAETRRADSVLGGVLHDLRQMGLEESTLLIVVGDHGEEFFEHNGFGHGHDVFEEQAHVPLLVKWPQRTEFAHMPRQVDAPVSLLDVWPTLTDYLQLVRPAKPVQGHTLRPVLSSAPVRAPDAVVTESLRADGGRVAYRDGALKLRLRYHAGAMGTSADEVAVYDLSHDPAETTPLAAADPRVAPLVARARARFDQRWSGQVRAPAPPRPGAEVQHVSSAALERLRVLGYLK